MAGFPGSRKALSPAAFWRGHRPLLCPLQGSLAVARVLSGPPPIPGPLFCSAHCLPSEGWQALWVPEVRGGRAGGQSRWGSGGHGVRRPVSEHALQSCATVDEPLLSETLPVRATGLGEERRLLCSQRDTESRALAPPRLPACYSPFRVQLSPSGPGEAEAAQEAALACEFTRQKGFLVFYRTVSQ